MNQYSKLKTLILDELANGLAPQLHYHGVSHTRDDVLRARTAADNFGPPRPDEPIGRLWPDQTVETLLPEMPPESPARPLWLLSKLSKCIWLISRLFIHSAFLLRSGHA